MSDPTTAPPDEAAAQQRRYRLFMAVESFLLLLIPLGFFLIVVSLDAVPMQWIATHFLGCVIALMGLWLIWRKIEQNPTRPAWPPFRRYTLFLNLGGLGALLGVVIGVTVGAISGLHYGSPGASIAPADYGILAGLWLGTSYGGVTGWLCSKLREWFRSASQVRPLSLVPWPVGGLLVVVSTVEAVRIGDTHEVVSIPLVIFGIPLSLAVAACIGQFVLSENRLRYHEEPGVEPTNVPATGMTHVCQGSGNCAIACIATATGRTYEEIAARCPKTTKNKAPNWKDMITLLNALSGSQWRVVPLSMFTLRLDEFRFPEWPVLVFVRPPWKLRQGHCIVVNGTVVHDPNFAGPVDLTRYENRGWNAFLALQGR